MNKLNWFRNFCSILVPVVLTACAPPQYSAADLASLQAKEVRGVVTKQSRGSFILKDSGGKEETYRTGQLTQYMPVEYRSQEGDEVRVAFKESLENTGRLKRSVLQLEALEVAPRNKQLANPIDGEVVATGHGSALYPSSFLLKRAGEEDSMPVYVAMQAKIVVDGKETQVVDGFSFSRLVGKQVKVTAERLPIFRGNAYIYVAQRIVAP